MNWIKFISIGRLMVSTLTFFLLGLILYEQTDQFSNWSIEFRLNHWISAIPLLGFYGLYQLGQGFIEFRNKNKFMQGLFFLASPIAIYVSYVFIDVISHSYWRYDTEFLFLIFLESLSVLHLLDFIYQYQKKQNNKNLPDILDL